MSCFIANMEQDIFLDMFFALFFAVSENLFTFANKINNNYSDLSTCIT